MPQPLGVKKSAPWPAYLLCAVSGALMVAAFAPLGWWWCGWLALAPAWCLLRKNEAVRRHPLRYGYLIGLFFNGGSFWWIAAETPFGFTVMLIVLSSYPALWFLLVRQLLSRWKPGQPMTPRLIVAHGFLAAGFWVVLEWMRSWFLSGFNWNELGVSQTPCLHLRQLAALGGVPLLSFVLVVGNVLLAEALLALASRQKARLREAATPAVLCLGIAAASWGYGWFHLQRHRNEAPARSISYVCIQPNIAEIPYATASMSVVAPLEVDSFRIEEDLSLSAMAEQPDLLIWPEAITTQRLTLDPLIARSVASVMSRFRGDFLLGAEEMNGTDFYNCAYLLDPREKSIQDYRKIYLVILGEYLPWSDRFPLLSRLFWASATSFHAGTQPGCFTMTGQRVRFSPLICFEDTQPLAAQNAAQLHPDFFVTLTNDSWYSGTPAFWMMTQHLQNAVLRCVEHDRPLVRCGNTGITCEVGPDGTILARVQSEARPAGIGISGTLSRRLTLLTPQVTLYERWGDWVSLLGQLVTIAAAASFLIKWKRQTSGPKARAA